MQTEAETDNRSAVRRRVLKSGRIAFNGGNSTINATVRNISGSGAKLDVASVVGIPDTFDLLLEGNAPQPCRVVWRRLKELGVEFRSAH